jgi:hypothetical protein
MGGEKMRAREERDYRRREEGVGGRRGEKHERKTESGSKEGGGRIGRNKGEREEG